MKYKKLIHSTKMTNSICQILITNYIDTNSKTWALTIKPNHSINQRVQINVELIGNCQISWIRILMLLKTTTKSINWHTKLVHNMTLRMIKMISIIMKIVKIIIRIIVLNIHQIVTIEMKLILLRTKKVIITILIKKITIHLAMRYQITILKTMIITMSMMIKIIMIYINQVLIQITTMSMMILMIMIIILQTSL